MYESDQVSSSAFECSFCGYDLSGAMVGGVCSECGAPVTQSIRRSQVTTTSGAAIGSLIFGILSLVACSLLGPVAIVLYFRASKDIRAGRAAPGSKGMAVAGLVLGIIASAITLLIGIVFVLSEL